MTNKPAVLITEVDGVEVMSCEALSLLFGVTPEEIAEYLKSHIVDGMTAFPADWLKAGRRRISEAAAATGERELLRVLAYWGRRDRNAEIVLIDDTNDGEVKS
jgi:hypothetical protein